MGGTQHRRRLGKAGGREAQTTLPTGLSASPLGEEGSQGLVGSQEGLASGSLMRCPFQTSGIPNY